MCFIYILKFLQNWKNPRVKYNKVGKKIELYMKEAYFFYFFPSNICRCLLKACNALNHEKKRNVVIVSTQRFDRLGIFALPCQTKNGTTKKNFHSIQEMQKNKKNTWDDC